MHEGNMGAPNYHISQRKLSDDVIKAMGGRLSSPRESWTEAHSRNVARHLAVEFRRRQLDAADVAARQRMWKATATQPVANGAASIESSQKYQHQGPMQLAASLAEPSAWVSPTGIPPGLVNAASLNGAAPGNMQTPWIPPPQADVLKGINQLPNIVGAAKAHGQPVMDQSALMAPMRPGGFRNVMPQLASIPRHSAEAQMQGRAARNMRTPHHQMPVAAAAYGHPQHSTQQHMEQVCDFVLSLSPWRN